MPSISPDNLARVAVAMRLADPSTGFNPNYTAALVNYPTAPAFTIDFTSPTSKNFFMGQMTPDQVQGTSAFTYPLVRLWAKAGANKNAQKFQRFAGPVRVYGAVDLSNKLFKSARLIHDSETWGDAIIGTMVETFNGPAVQYPWMQAVVYDGTIAWERGPLEENASNWRQTITFIWNFEVIVG